MKSHTKRICLCVDCWHGHCRYQWARNNLCRQFRRFKLVGRHQWPNPRNGHHGRCNACWHTGCRQWRYGACLLRCWRLAVCKHHDHADKTAGWDNGASANRHRWRASLGNGHRFRAGHQDRRFYVSGWRVLGHQQQVRLDLYCHPANAIVLHWTPSYLQKYAGAAFGVSVK